MCCWTTCNIALIPAIAELKWCWNSWAKFVLQLLTLGINWLQVTCDEYSRFLTPDLLCIAGTSSRTAWLQFVWIKSHSHAQHHRVFFLGEILSNVHTYLVPNTFKVWNSLSPSFAVHNIGMFLFLLVCLMMGFWIPSHRQVTVRSHIRPVRQSARILYFQVQVLIHSHTEVPSLHSLDNTAHA